MPRPRFFAAFGLFAALLTVYVLTADYGNYLNNDVIATFTPASELAKHGTIFLDRFHGNGPWVIHVNGHYVTNRFPGSIFWATPFYLLDPSRGLYPSPTPGAIAAATSAAVAMTVLFIVLRRLGSARAAFLGTLLAAFGTSTWSVSADQLWTHGPGQMLLGAMALAAASELWLTMGLFGGLALFVRPQLGFAVAGAGLYLGVLSRRWAALYRITLAAVPGCIGYLLYNRIAFGRFSFLGGYGVACHGHACLRTAEQIGHQASHNTVGFLGNYAIDIAGTLVSPGRGVLVYSPFLLLLIPGVRAAWKNSPDWIRACALAGTVCMGVQLAVNGFSGATGFYGYRLPLAWLTLCAPLLFLCYFEWTAQTKLRRRLFVVFATLSVTVQALGAVPFADPLNSIRPWTTSDILHVADTIGLGGMATVAILSVLITAVILRLRIPLGHSRDYRVRTRPNSVGAEPFAPGRA